MSPALAWLVGVAAGLLLLWLCLIVGLLVVARRQHGSVGWREVLRLVPDVLVLLKRLTGDRTMPASTRWKLAALLVYLASPIDLVPDFVPIVGYADDAVIVLLAVRSVARRAGPEALERHWPGTAEGLAVLQRLAGVGAPQHRSRPRRSRRH
jgi:uncharacterized membrane protein YkvA (DUF1232 family)